ncbi:MerR family transcriptional regulator [Actinomadura roseirufa]|uniref:MerR family transcriptional regulator n=1 Tax=Actinomadura roseirufa TaxID=2094049 RepID=UPI0010418393|nr:MerR family transcriptional regulator [Actinomadura roseirufa]
MRIGELSRLTGVSVRALRYYEEQGLLHPPRRPSGYREYREEDAVTVRGIRLLLAAGLSTATIGELLPCMTDDGDGPTPACGGMLPDLRRERERLTAAASELLTARDRLDVLIEATTRLDPVDPEDCAAVLTASPAHGLA